MSIICHFGFVGEILGLFVLVLDYCRSLTLNITRSIENNKINVDSNKFWPIIIRDIVLSFYATHGRWVQGHP